ncbi:MAG: hypothetical protein PF795_00185 [Kiritimatiellae bacterium]|jgi:hypothetical protein|nr:hypothetical protein [Kiritimatiellia bacterium]
MHTPESSSLFTPWTNPANSVTSLILTTRPAPVQQCFYYTHSGFSDDGRFLWIQCGFPPPGGRHSQHVLGVIDFQTDDIRIYPESQFPSAEPWIDSGTGDVYWGNHLDIWKRGPLAADPVQHVNKFPADRIEGKLHRLSTQPTFSPNGDAVNIDASYKRADGSHVTLIGEMPLDGGPYSHWATLPGRTFDHGLFSPVDPDLQLISHEFWLDQPADTPFDGSLPYHRMWLIRKGEEAKPVLPHPVSHSGHEWWDPDGAHIWYVQYGVGIKRVDIVTGKEELIQEGAFSHAHSDQSGRYVVIDRMDDPGIPDCNVLFLDTQTGDMTEIVNSPPLPTHATQCVHLHPHPRFCLNDQYICHTTTVHGRVDIALVPVASLIT